MKAKPLIEPRDLRFLCINDDGKHGERFGGAEDAMQCIRDEKLAKSPASCA